MSGFVVVANLDGAPISPALMDRLTDALQFRGPDAREVWLGEQVGFGHTLFQTTDEGTRERQPCSLDGRTWITGDVRVDRRAEFVRDLHQAGRTPAATATDPELILHAYQAWGEALLDQLIGDFSFAIWDGINKHLFCARDQLGVKPFFYATVAKQLVASNTLSCLREHGAIPDALNDEAVADFLLYGVNSDPSTTTYEAIKRLPGGHTLSWSRGQEPLVRRYWTLPVYTELRLPRPSDYVEKFRTLLEEATADRLRTPKVGVHMSGGLDSPLIAASAVDLLGRAEVRAHTVVYGRLFDDKERHYSSLVARSLDIPIDYTVADDYALFEDHVGSRFNYPEPMEARSQAPLFDKFNRGVASSSRVALTGLDGDALLSGSWLSHLTKLARDFDVSRLLKDAVSFARVKQDPFGALSRRLHRPRGIRTRAIACPTWLEPRLEQRLKLQDQWSNRMLAASSVGGPRESARINMLHQNWPAIFESFDAGVTGIPLDHRHPLLDLRLVGFFLSLPAIPWCVDKYIIRASAKDRLPRAIRKRRKAPLPVDPMPPLLDEYIERSKNSLTPHPRLGQFVDLTRFPAMIDEAKSDTYWFGLRGLVLNQWLVNQRDERHE